MRFVIALIAVLTIATGVSSLSVSQDLSGGSVLVAAQQQPPPNTVEVDVDLNRSGGDWWTNPVWLAIGGIAVVLLVVLIVMFARGGGTTVIKE